MSDLLALATHELQKAPVNHERALHTLARLRQPRRRRLRVVRAVILPVAATLVGLCALAQTARERALSLAPSPPATQEVGTVVTAPLPAPKGITILPPPPPSTPAPSALAPLRRPAARSPDPADALYRRAFEAYRDHDDARALEDWDAYLALAGPHGRFVPEAHFIRAATLLRLGRKADARDALERFARGDWGSYRRAEARALLQSL